MIALMISLTTVIGVADEKKVLVELNTNLGSIVVELYPKKARATVKNFLEYVDSGFYDGTIFHRVIDGFMIQGGGFDVEMKQKKTNDPIMNESNNELSNTFGTISMARTSDPHSATSQFFINVSNNTYLNYQNDQKPGYCVFGRVVEGINIVNQIKQVAVTSRKFYKNVPVAPVIIKRARTIVESQMEGFVEKPSIEVLPITD